ncbi:hypothetical protein H0H81_001900 [Sphagnurus paluster]|uniref:MFS general substrate transporter n=1 Tax=Sphagnurus paluster TaxID=117069 RepID=A0A9P7GN65_9AGAR|nr:hypothetical protein H0H81_001900 [Sphagnurus paluster]
MISLTQPAQGLGIGSAVGITYVPGVSLLSHYFHRRRALAMGIAVSGSGLGGAVHSIILNKLFHGPVGFHNGVRASAGMVGGLLIIAILLMKPRLPPISRKHGSTLQDLRKFLRDPPYVIMVFGTVVVFAGLYFPIFFLQLNAIKNGISQSLAFYTLVILNASSAVGRIVPNLLVYRIGVFNLMIPSVVISGALVFVILALKDTAGTIVFAILYGFFSGACDQNVYDDLDTQGLGGLVGTPIAGALLSKDFIWWRPSLFSAISVLIGALCFSTTRAIVARRKGTSWL